MTTITATYETKSEAQIIVSKLEAATYYLGHGEYSAPEYTVRKIRNAARYEIYAKYNYYAGTFNRKPNGAICEDTAYYA